MEYPGCSIDAMTQLVSIVSKVTPEFIEIDLIFCNCFNKFTIEELLDKSCCSFRIGKGRET